MTDTESTETDKQPSEETLDYDAEYAKLNEEFDATRPEQTQPEEDPEDLKAQLAALNRKVRDMERSQIEESSNRDVEATYKAIIGDTDLSVPRDVANSLIHGRIATDPTKTLIFTNRQKNPAAYKKMIGLENRWLKENFGKKETTETSDIEAVEASVRGQHTATPQKKIDATRTGNMTDAEFQKWVEEATH